MVIAAYSFRRPLPHDLAGNSFLSFFSPPDPARVHEL